MAVSRFFLKSSLALAILVTGALIATDRSSAQTRIAIAVNNGVVTTNQIIQRARFLRLTGFKGDTRKEARKQLTNEELQFQEGKRLGFSVPEKIVTDALARVAKSNRLSLSQFSKALGQQGVQVGTFRRLLKANILWQQIVVARARSEGAATAQQRDVTSILFNRENKGKNRRVQEYTLQQIVFVVKKGSSKRVVAQRQREADTFRTRHKTCTEAKDAALKLSSNGVIMKLVGRFTEATLPSNLASDVQAAKGQVFTTPRVGELGVGMYAICNRREIVDNSVPTDGLNFAVGRLATDELEKKSVKWMRQLTARAKIVNR